MSNTSHDSQLQQPVKGRPLIGELYETKYTVSWNLCSVYIALIADPTR